MFDWFRTTDTQQSIQKSSIRISQNNNLFIECQPKDPHTASNIVITAFISKIKRVVVPTKVQWTRNINSNFDLHAKQYPLQRIFHRSNTYMCQPSDLGCYLQAKITSLDQSINGTAQVIIGPIRIDVMMKRLIEGALFSGTLLSQILLVQGQQEKQSTLRLYPKYMQLTEDQKQKRLIKNYSISEPKIQTNPKDPTKLYIRFEQDQQNEVQSYIQQIFDKQVLVQSQSQSSKTRLFKANYCLNKIQMKFVTRHTRDLFLLTHKSFICMDLMKSEIIMNKIQKLELIGTQSDYQKFLKFISLRQQINRLVRLVNEVEKDRNKKIEDLAQLEESIGQLSLTYLKIIEDKGKNCQVDFNQSYSQISIKREQIIHRKDFRKLNEENKNLKDMVRDLTEQIKLIKFFKKEQNNQSVVLNQTSNPFLKKSIIQQNIHKINDLQPANINVVELSRSYARILNQNQQLKRNNQMKERSRDMGDLLDVLQDQSNLRQFPQESIIENLKKQNQKLKQKLNQLAKSNQRPRITSLMHNNSMQSNKWTVSPDQSQLSINQSMISQNYINQSMNSQAELRLLQQKFTQISSLNQKLLEENSRLRNQRNNYRENFKQLVNKNKNQPLPKFDESKLLKQQVKKIQDQNRILQQQKRILQEQNQALINQRNSLKNRIDSILRQKQIIINQIKISQDKTKELKDNNIKQSIVRNQQGLDQLAMESQKLKKINYQLLEQIKNLKIQIEQYKSNGYNSRVIELEGEVQYLRQYDTGQDQQNIIRQLGQYKKKITKLQEENNQKTVKIHSQQHLIQKLMQNEKSKGLQQGEQKLKKRIKELQQEIILIRRSTTALNRSRDISMDMEGYYEQQVELLKKQMSRLLEDNQRLSVISEKYAKDAREARQALKNKDLPTI